VLRPQFLAVVVLGFSISTWCADRDSVRDASADEWLRRARDAQGRGLIKPAIEYATRALDADPEDPRPALFLRARLYERTRQFASAESDFNRLLELAPDEPAFLLARGLIRLRLSDFNGSVADFDRCAAVRPSDAAQLWQRGIALFYAGRFDDARKQFEVHRTVNPRDVENSAWHFASIARVEGVDSARLRWMPVEGDPRVPMAEIQELMRGRGSVDAVTAAVEARRGRPGHAEAKFYAELYLALHYGAEGRRDLEARHAAQAAKDALAFGIMGDIAQLHAAWVASRMKAVE
jgi:lipoprotein NlpI